MWKPFKQGFSNSHRHIESYEMTRPFLNLMKWRGRLAAAVLVRLVGYCTWCWKCHKLVAKLSCNEFEGIWGPFAPAVPQCPGLFYTAAPGRWMNLQLPQRPPAPAPAWQPAVPQWQSRQPQRVAPSPPAVQHREFSERQGDPRGGGGGCRSSGTGIFWYLL